MTQDTSKMPVTTEKKESINNDQQKNKEKKEKNNPPTKVVIRRLPPSMNMETFLEQISPAPNYDYMYFVKADMSLGQHAFSRAYINFVNQEDIFLFKDKFDGYVFVDQKGNEYSAVVEFSPFQKIPKKKPKKKDTKCGTIEQDPDYIKFLESLQNPEEVSLPTAEFYLEEIENRERELRANNGVSQASTPLIDYLRQKKAEKQRIREEKREERKKRELEKKRMKEEERRRRKADKEKEKEREKAKDRSKDGKDKDKDRLSDDKSQKDAPVKLLKNPERIKDRPKYGEKETIEREIVSSGAESRERLPRASSSKDWESERRRREDEKRHKEKLRDRKDRDKFKKDRDDVKPAIKTASRIAGDSNSLSSEERPRSSTTIRSSDWHRDRSERNAQKASASQASAKSGHERSARGGKSYEKSRESLAKARGESKTSGSGKGFETIVGNSSSTFKEANDGEAFAADAESEAKREGEQLVADEDFEAKNTGDDKAAGYSESEKSFDFDGESYQDGRPQREYNSRDLRSERRIRNKDRPSIELYRPGMRRLSLQRNSPQKDSPSSSSSPSPTAQMLGKQLPVTENGSVGEQQTSVMDGPNDEEADRTIEIGRSGFPEDCNKEATYSDGNEEMAT